ncbi:MAG: hypothetical protein IJ054_02570 [Lachnospiraceae bacterium]|nr:hypothetical protein [Lachnospiraceae bacterium]MBQ9234778.1 hypothetical protein [Lachnospiraceae bacterium]MBQ9608721.1 hypothetical protein [Lachnospiraceae bacterium]
MDVEIELIGEDGVDTYIQYIPSVMISDIKEGKKLCFGLYGKEIGDDRKTYGSVVVSLDASIDGKEGNVLVVDAVTPEKLLCNHDIMTIVTGKLLEYIIHNDMLGMILSIVYPDMSDVESVFDMFNFIRLEDGNSIYEASIKELIKHKMFSKDLHDFDKYISSIEELSVSERNSFFKEMGTRYPEGLSPNHLPGKMLNGLSFIYKEHSEIKGFVLVSGISDELIYVGSLYNEGDPSYAAALLKCLAREVIRKTSYTKVMFAAATDSVKRFCDNLTYEIESLNKRWIRYYYLEV